MLIPHRCAKHPNQVLEVTLKIGADTVVYAEVEPCPDCHATDEWNGYKDGLADRKREKGAAE